MDRREEIPSAERREPTDAALGAVAGAARLGLRFFFLPAAALPRDLRRGLLDSARSLAQGAALAPRLFAETLDGFAADLDDLETRVRRREPLASLRRERRAGDG